ncbi:hypothetical protein WOLCODRAFT_150796 [Wolfiporia cocos MD-104 SS10]|uniref:Nucleoplasmin-like domain-containing protein n=1 Tax=Wolfiporia cocos (strain MD-104) TaxID=742152 RepID=A0A2H3JX64_WOLCO|nr:hypothetical protein WOLCODRAFT_150796 [Wolfiporia cocos MD-104 SS10]
MWLESLDKRLHEYRITGDGERTVTCFVASEAGQALTINMEHLLRRDLVLICCQENQVLCSGFSESMELGQIRGVCTSKNTSRSLEFAVVPQPGANESEELNLDDCGSLTIHLRRVKDSWKECYREPQSQPVDLQCRKAGTHYITLGEEYQTRTLFQAARHFDHQEAPFATFVFKFGPREFLEAKGIIPETEADLTSEQGPFEGAGYREPSCDEACSVTPDDPPKRVRFSASPEPQYFEVLSPVSSDDEEDTDDEESDEDENDWSLKKLPHPEPQSYIGHSEDGLAIMVVNYWW